MTKVVTAGFSQVAPGIAPALKAINAHLSKRNLTGRFPVNKVALKKCG